MSSSWGWVTIGVFVSFFLLLLSEEWGMDFWMVTWIQHIPCTRGFAGWAGGVARA
jgi:hypothetical protein